MTNHGHHHGNSQGYGMLGQSSGGGLLDALLSNANGLSSIGRTLGTGRDFWLGAAIGAAVMAAVANPEARSALGSLFRGRTAAPAASPPPAAPETQNGSEGETQKSD